MKTLFELNIPDSLRSQGYQAEVTIKHKYMNKPRVSFRIGSVRDLNIKDKDLERFAVNILKALKSKRLK